jgi:hypothetical protein
MGERWVMMRTKEAEREAMSKERNEDRKMFSAALLRASVDKNRTHSTDKMEYVETQVGCILRTTE